MGTNFYAEKQPCPCCDHVSERIHIGKRSGGWVFAFHGYEGGPETLNEWLEMVEEADYRIVDEYGKQYNPEEFRSAVEETLPMKKDTRWRSWVSSDGYDYVTGEFS